MSEHKLENDIRMFNSVGRIVIVTHSYEGHGKDDPSGYYYHYEDDPKSRHWISNGAIGIRFSMTPNKTAETAEEALVLRSQRNGARRKAVIKAAMNGVQHAASIVGAVSVVETEKGFCVVFGNDDRCYFDAVEM